VLKPVIESNESTEVGPRSRLEPSAVPGVIRRKRRLLISNYEQKIRIGAGEVQQTPSGAIGLIAMEHVCAGEHHGSACSRVKVPSEQVTGGVDIVERIIDLEHCVDNCLFVNRGDPIPMFAEVMCGWCV